MRNVVFLFFATVVIFGSSCGMLRPLVSGPQDEKVLTGIIDLDYTPLVVIKEDFATSMERPYELGFVMVYEGNKHQVVHKYLTGESPLRGQVVFIDAQNLASKMKEASLDSASEERTMTMLLLCNVTKLNSATKEEMLESCNGDRGCEKTIKKAFRDGFDVGVNFGVVFIKPEELENTGGTTTPSRTYNSRLFGN